MEVSVLGLGAWEIGLERRSLAEVEAILGGALDAGLNVVDTASAYFDSEELLGRALGARRAQLYLFTKCGPTDGFSRSDWSAAGLRRQIEQSLRRLRTDRLDLIQLHSCSLEVLARGEAIGALEQARRDGLVRFLGYAGDGEPARWAVASGRFQVLQTSLSIADQEALSLTLPLARERGMGVVAKRPIANVVWRLPAEKVEPYYRGYWQRLRKLAYPFLAASLDEAVGTALRYTLSWPGVATALVGTGKPGRFEQNAALLAAGPSPEAEQEAIRRRWLEVAGPDWVGEV